MSLLRFPFLLIVLVYQGMFLALGQIWTNKVRSLLTTVGIVIGIASVTAVIAALTGLKTSVLAEFETFGAKKLFIFPYWPDSGPLRHGPYERIRFRTEQFEDLEQHCPSIEHLTRLQSINRPVSHGRKGEAEVRVLGIEPAWHKVENRSITLGRPFGLVDGLQARFVCLINPKVQEKLELDRNCIGQSIFVGQNRFLIVGMVEPRSESSMFGDTQQGLEVFIPFATARRLNPRGGFFCIATSRSPSVSEEARAEVSFFLRRSRRIRPGDPDTFRVEAIDKYIEQFKSIAGTITIAAAGVVGISLLVGGVGIMNIMLVSVSERTREIGLRKAVGARPSAILLQFLIEAVMLCFFGGAVGLLAGQGLTSILTHIPNAHLEKAYIPGWAVALSFGFAASVGLIFGMFPAIKAARLDPIDALRHE